VVNGVTYVDAVLEDMLHVEHLRSNLVSIPAIMKKGMQVNMQDCLCEITMNGKISGIEEVFSTWMHTL
jgi:hypothetical protein